MSFSGDAIRVPTRRVISQAGFDQVVEENIAEFGMAREEAARDAVEQLEQQGYSLAGLVTDGSDPGLHPVVAALRAVRAWAPLGDDALPAAADPDGDGSSGGGDGGGCAAADALLAQARADLDRVAAGLAGASPEAARSRSLARANAGVTILCAAVARALDCGAAGEGALRSAMLALRAACSGYDDARREVDMGTVRTVYEVLGRATAESNEIGRAHV